MKHHYTSNYMLGSADNCSYVRSEMNSLGSGIAKKDNYLNELLDIN